MLMSSYIIMGPNASATAVSVPIYIPISMLIFSLERPHLFIEVTNGLLAVGNEVGLLVALAILKHVAQISELPVRQYRKRK